MSAQMTAAAPPARVGDDQIVVYSPLARKATTALAPPKAPNEDQTELLQLQQTVQNLLRQNAALRGRIRISEQVLRAEIQGAPLPDRASPAAWPDAAQPASADAAPARRRKNPSSFLSSPPFPIPPRTAQPCFSPQRKIRQHPQRLSTMSALPCASSPRQPFSDPKRKVTMAHPFLQAQTRNHGRELHLAGVIKSVRLQLPCEEGPWSETQQLCSLDTEVEALRKFVEYQYQHERLWGSDEIHSPRFWYEQGGFRGYKTGPDGDTGIWRREVKSESKMVMKTMTRAVGVHTEAEEGGVEIKNVAFW